MNTRTVLGMVRRMREKAKDKGIEGGKVKERETKKRKL